MTQANRQARPVYHHVRHSIKAHLTTVFAALAVSQWSEHQTGLTIRRFVKTARRYRTIQIQAGDHLITAADLVPEDLRASLAKISNAGNAAHQPDKSRASLKPAPFLLHSVAPSRTKLWEDRQPSWFTCSRW